MSIGWICTDNYTDGIHLVKRNGDNKELYVFVSHESYSEPSELVVKDGRNMETLNVEDFTHLQWYEYGSYYQCDDHPEHWIFDDGDDFYTPCPDCEKLHEELTCFSLSDSVYRYKSNIELKRIIELLDGLVSCGTDSDNWYKTSQGGIVVSHSEWGEFDDESTTWCKIIDASILNK